MNRRIAFRQHGPEKSGMYICKYIGRIMKYIRVTKDNLEQEHICCAISNNKDVQVSFKAIHLQSKEEAQDAPTPITTYAFFRDGEYVTNEQMNDKRFLKMIGK